MTEDQAVDELMRRGLLEVVPAKTFIVDKEIITVAETRRILPKEKERLFTQVWEYISKCAKSGAELKFRSLMARIRQLPESLKKEALEKAIHSNVHSQDETYGIDGGSAKKMILDAFSFQDYLEFNNGKKIYIQNEVVKGEIRLQTDYEFVILLNQEYSATASVTGSKKLPEKRSYLWLTKNMEEVTELYNLLLQKNFISPDTSLSQFHSVFSGRPVNEIVSVKWNKNPTDLLYFIIRLGDTNNIENEANNMDFQRLTSCFIDAKGSPFKTNFKNLKKSILEEIQLEEKPAKRKAIEDIVMNFC